MIAGKAIVAEIAETAMVAETAVYSPCGIGFVV